MTEFREHLEGVALPDRAVRARLRVSGSFLLRLTLILLILASLGLYAYNRLLSTSSLRGAVNAPIVTLRSPIDGTVTAGALEAGQFVATGAAGFQVRDTRLDEHRRVELEARLVGARSRAIAMNELLASLDALHAELAQRTNSYSTLEVGRLQATVDGHQRATADATQAYLFAQQREDRATRLVGSGVAVTLRSEEATRDRLAAQSALDRAVAELLTSRQTLQAARTGIFTQNGFGGSAYAQQRSDEIQVRQIDTRYQRATLLAEIEGLVRERDAETNRVAAMRDVTIPFPVSGIVTAVHAAPGTEVIRGNPLADVLDCSRLYVEATLGARWLAGPRPGDIVQVSIYGIATPLQGRIRTLRDTALSLDPGRTIPLSDRDARQSLTALIDLDPTDTLPSGRQCPAGQPATVRFR